MPSSSDPFASYDTADLAAGIGALQLLPENADRLGRLEYLADLAANRVPNTEWKPLIPRSEWERLVNGPSHIPPGIIQHEDPFNYPFTESFPFSDGTHTVLGGLGEAGPFITRLFAEALFQSNAAQYTPEFRRWASRLFLLTLRLGDEIARRAGLGRGERAQRSPDGQCVVPDADRFRQLKNAIAFTEDEWIDLLGRLDGAPIDLDPLLLRPRLGGQPRAGQESPVIARPILRLPNRYVVVTPGNLLTAARHAIVSRAVAGGYGPILAKEFRNVTFVSVCQSLQRMGMDRIWATDPHADGLFVEGMFDFDRDKIAHIIVAADPLTEWNADTVYGEWDASEVGTSIPVFQSAVRTRCFEAGNEVENILHLNVISGLGRGHFFSFSPNESDPRCLTLSLSAESLEVMSWLPDTQQLTLWQFAQSRIAIRKHARVVAFDALDEYGCYRAHGCSFYATDEGRPDMLSILPDFAERLRCEAHDRADRLAVFHPYVGGIVEVFNAQSERAVPIHCPFPSSGLPFGLHVGGLPLSIWVFVPGPPPDDRYRALRIQLVEMVAYWIWQFTPTLTAHLSAVAIHQNFLAIELEQVPGEEWFSYSSELEGDNTMSARVVSPERLQITIGSGVLPKLASADNAGERLILRTLLDGLRDWGRHLRAPSLGSLTDQDLSDWIERHAPLGVKKKLFMLDADRHPELIKEGLPPYRPLQLFDHQQVLDDVGRIAAWQFSIGPEEVPDDRRIELFNGLVSQLYDGLERLVATLDPERLLDALVAQNERVIYEREFLRLTIPTRTACFGTLSSVIERLRDELPQAATAAVAGRFLIEYVTARPPSGSRPFSLSQYDRLLAVAAQIISFGMSSDALKYGLSNRSVEMLRSGRLGIGLGHFESALDDFGTAYAREVADRNRDAFDDHWSNEPICWSPDVESLMTQMDLAAAEEFGFSMRELNRFFAEVNAAGSEIPTEPKSLALDAFLDRLSGGLGWARDRVAAAFDLFALRPRGDFLTPPEGFMRAEVFPWRFNRRLSHVRKPLLVRATPNGDEVVWGVRTVQMAAGYLNSLCTGGRLIARTDAMKKAMGAFHNHRGREFNRAVAALFRTVPGLMVREQVKKIGKRRLARSNGQDLGDIDVLVADPTTRTLTLVETKDLTAALTPPELRNEMDRLFGSPAHAGDLDRFNERVAWVRSNLDEVLLCAFGVTESAHAWVIRPTLVLDSEMISTRLTRRPDLRVLSIRDLEELLSPH